MHALWGCSRSHCSLAQQLRVIRFSCSRSLAASAGSLLSAQRFLLLLAVKLSLLLLALALGATAGEGIGGRVAA